MYLLVYLSHAFHFLGVIDFDLETKGDPGQHAEYARDTFQYYKLREATFKVVTVSYFAFNFCLPKVTI